MLDPLASTPLFPRREVTLEILELGIESNEQLLQLDTCLPMLLGHVGSVFEKLLGGMSELFKVLDGCCCEGVARGVPGVFLTVHDLAPDVLENGIRRAVAFGASPRLFWQDQLQYFDARSLIDTATLLDCLRVLIHWFHFLRDRTVDVLFRSEMSVIPDESLSKLKDQGRVCLLRLFG